MRMFQKSIVRLCLRIAANRNGNPPEVEKLLSNSAAFNEYCDTHFAKSYGADANGKMFVAATSPGALPPGWFLNILNWVMTNFPQILKDILAVLNLFPHAPLMGLAGFSWHEAFSVIAEVLPSFAKIAADAMAGVSVADLVVKYGAQEIALFQQIIGEFSH